MAAARIAGPFPADQTPDRAGDMPIHNFPIERSVANPTPAGMHRSHQRNRHANDRRKAATAPVARMIA